jgi:hypothetical protein
MMSQRFTVRTLVSWAVAIASVGVFVVIPIAEPVGDLVYAILFGSATASFVLVGCVLVNRVPGNRIGTLLLIAGALFAVAFGLTAYASAAAAAEPPWPGAALVAVLSDPIFVWPIIIALIGIPLVFPNGRLISRRWRWLVVLAVTATAMDTLSILLAHGPVGPANLPNPLAVPDLAPLAATLGGISSVTSVIGFGGAAAALWVRYRRGDLIERQQLKWLLAVAALAAVFFPAAFILPDPTASGVAFLLGTLTLIAFPVAIAIAILRYQLFEIDRIVSRTVAYVLITAVLVVAYAIAILVLQAPLETITGGNTVSVALSTLVVAALFQPLRRRVQAVVDRRFDRARFDAERTTAAFSERLRDEVDIATVTGDLDATVRTALKPSALGLWLRRPDGVTNPAHPPTS